ncbi:MAG TPA: tRNA (adenosine(37)-N6)-threonylcarbamoyltransferase complex dimerization subunit type 1 TsaB [Patescibacteria group bacterium]|nr:tRNA (adenosine(37)-N6)-threonylcarbamoyltransferase complex dimerization subunit type 1 TsaB [Patescibacteria group bacterium]
MKLIIDTLKIRSATVALGTFQKTSHDLLPLIEEALQENHISVTDLTEITVNEGPGSFTGLRVGIAVANALGLLLRIPVNGKKAIATPTYS